MPTLETLAEAAHGLHTTLLDPERGACVPALPSTHRPLPGGSIRVGALTADEVRTDVRAAVRHAGTEGAVLVLALMGHGFSPGDGSDLYLMVGDSREGESIGAVNVSQLLTDAADHVGLAGLIGIIDTCSAAGAVPAIGRIVTGQRSGRTRCGLLMASGVGQNAYDLRLTADITDLLRSGVDDAPAVLELQTVRSALGSKPSGPSISVFEFGGDPSTPQPLWLSRNYGHQAGRASAYLGRAGRAELDQALAAIDDQPAMTSRWTPEELASLRERLSQLPLSPQAVRAQQVADSLFIAAQTARFLQEWIPGAIETDRLRRAVALTAAPQAPRVTALDDVSDVLERLALSYPARDGSCRSQICRFVVALALDDVQNLNDPLLRTWALSITALKQVNDAVAWANRLNSERRLRLVVSLHASIGGTWPELIETWLVLDGEIHSKERLQCAGPDRSGVELAIARAVDKAERVAASMRLPLRQVDVAVPTQLLADWRPEQIKRGEWLGVRFDVVTRWAERLSPPDAMQWVVTSAEGRLARMANGEMPVQWLDIGEIADLVGLEERLTGGAYPAVALSATPAEKARLFSLLLAYVPVMLWPCTVAPLDAGSRLALTHCWDRMPAELLAAYRDRWRNPEQSSLIADLRAVWDDQEWLDFCKSYQFGKA
ncbi:hypothetical protein O7627_00915 [Solwaraspora sp. WMMD1047]|uniref:vWA-MoxR associated conflict system protein n=1 Tax=Solwaraspora sp. WMMD1047 TaxID=3016102 RepID=UPI002416DCCA|nr:hypothetical protein [Solwaraspora sp. WMMD1047]MDG4827859.1 hypothetical protein [Solwaraspora sp. WMMD1047]